MQRTREELSTSSLEVPASSERAGDPPFLPRWARLAAALMNALLRVSFLLPLSCWLVARILSRLSFIDYLAGSDIRGFTRALLAEIRRKQQRLELSSRYLEGWIAALLLAALHSPARRRAAEKRLGARPPAFAILSPSAACNLRCSHCYAATGELPRHTVSFDALDRLITALEHAGTSLIILSGGEPLLWRDHGRGICELAAAHPQLLFIVYSNGTQLDEAIASQLRELGNILPLLSVEGLEPETDAVRGQGVYASVRRAMTHLSEKGVLFGISVTASRRNWELLGSERFFHAIVDEAGASFIWMLDLAPLGRADEDAVLDPASREALQAALNQQSARGRLLVSFLHTPRSPSGCFGARSFDGFFYLDWDAVVHRCVYQPTITAKTAPLLEGAPDTEAFLLAVARLDPCPFVTELRSQTSPGDSRQSSSQPSSHHNKKE